MENVKFYMQKVDANDALIADTLKDLEVDFQGLKYLKCEGIDTIGAVKNCYEENYSDADKVRVYIPKDVKNEPTDIVLTLIFVGENRRAVKDEFENYIRDGLHKYYDTARNKWFIFYVKDEIKPAEEKWYGSTPYLKYEYKLRNIYGKAFDVK